MSRTIFPGYAVDTRDMAVKPAELAEYRSAGQVIRVDLVRREITIQLDEDAAPPCCGADVVVRFVDFAAPSEFGYADAVDYALDPLPQGAPR